MCRDIGAVTEKDMSDKKKLTRREARELAFKLIFAKEFDPEADTTEFYDKYIENTESLTNSYVYSTFSGVCEAKSELDAEIEGASSSWKISRMSTTTRSILRLAVFELTRTETPAKVVINEAVEIIKLYDDQNAPSFVNGILNNIARSRGLISDEQG